MNICKQVKKNCYGMNVGGGGGGPQIVVNNIIYTMPKHVLHDLKILGLCLSVVM
jgi:hypothetical protein